MTRTGLIVRRACVLLALSLLPAACSDSDSPPEKGGGSANASGGGWAALGSGMDWPVHALTIGPDGKLYAGGRFREAGGVEANFVAAWDGSAWSAMPGKFQMDLNALAFYDDGSGPALHAASSEGAGGLRLSKWAGGKWQPLGDSINGDIAVLQPFDAGGKKLLLAGGQINSIGQLIVGSFAQWDGKEWARGLGASFNNSVYAINITPDGKVAVGGWFTSLDYSNNFYDAKGLTIWDGQAWTSPGGGIGELGVYAIAVFDDGSGPALYAAGEFQTAGGQTARNIARWDGKAWQEVGGGVDGAIRSMTVVKTPAGPRLYVGGRFDNAGSVEAKNIAAWDGKAWSALGEGVDDEVKALAAHNGKLYVGGDFMQAGGKEANRIAVWTP